MDNEEKLKMMRCGSVPSVLLKLGLPTMVGMMVSSLYSVVDAYFVGGLGESQMGAIFVVFPVVQLVVGLGMTFGSGGSYISRLLGEGNQRQADRTAATAVFSSLTVGALVIILSLTFLDEVLAALGATETMLPYAREYAIIYIPGAILNIFNVCMNNLVVAEGRAKLNLAAMLIGCGLNAALDPVMIYGLGLGVAGASIATVVSQALTTAMYLAYILMGKSVLHFSIRNASLDPAIFKAIFSVGVPIMMFQSVSCLSMALTNAAAKPCGDAAIAAVGAVTRIMSLGTYVVFGFMKGFQPLVGYNYGARQYGRVRAAIRVSLVWSTLFCSMAAFVFYLFPESVVSIFSKEADCAMVGIGVRALRASAVVFPVFGLQIVFMVLFLALGKTVQGGVLSISRQGLFFVPLILLLPRLFGLDGLIWAQPAADALSAALTLALAIPEMKKLRALTRESHSAGGLGRPAETAH